MRLLALSILFLSATCLPGQSTPAPKHPFTAHDWAILRSARAVAVSANSGLILYEVDHGADSGPRQTEWWTIHRDGTARQKLDVPKDFTPSGFTRQDDAVYGTFQIGGQSQFAVFPLHGLTAQSVPSTIVLLPRGTQAITPSPDGTRYALTFDPRPPDPLADVRTVVEPDQTGIYIVQADGTGGARWCDTLDHVSDLAWSPIGTSLAVLSSTPRIGFHLPTSFLDVCTKAGSHRTSEIHNAISSLAWTDEGKTLVFVSTSTHVLTPDHVWTVAATGGTATDRTPSLQGSVLALSADPQGHLWVSTQRGLNQAVEEFKNGDLSPTYKWAAGIVSLPVFSPYSGSSGDLAFFVADPAHTANVAIADSGTLKTLTDEGQDQLSTMALGEVRAVHWTSKEGIALEGVVTFPDGFQQGQRYPFLVLPHGGPEANDSLVLDPLSRTIAAKGYVVIQPEYRGSTGYGSAFLDAIYQHFGDRAFRDVDSATDFAIAQGWADPNRLAIFGWSAGGFMTAWTVTQTDRYRAAIEGAGITEWSSFLWTSDIGQTDYDARWSEEDPDAFRRFSAVDFAKNVKTPLLILHGTADIRVPTYQSIEYFQILAARGKTVRLVTYPGSPHFPRLWQQRLDVMHEVTDWLARYNP